MQNKEVLRAMRTSYDKPDRMRDLFKQLTGKLDEIFLINVFKVNDATRKTLDVVDNLLQRLTIIGEILSFKKILQKGLSEVRCSNRYLCSLSIDIGNDTTYSISFIDCS